MKNLHKKIIASVFGLIAMSFIGTSLWFVYRYMWFSVETIPADRWGIALSGVMVTLPVFLFYISMAEPFKD